MYNVKKCGKLTLREAYGELSPARHARTAWSGSGSDGLQEYEVASLWPSQMVSQMLLILVIPWGAVDYVSARRRDGRLAAGHWADLPNPPSATSGLRRCFLPVLPEHPSPYSVLRL